MKIIIAGGTGFIGRALVQRLSQAGHAGWIVSRSSAKAPAAAPIGDGSFRVVGWDQLEADPSELAAADAVVNLAGEPISQRWTSAAKKRIRDSRIETASRLGTLLKRAGADPQVLVQASGVNAYGFDETAAFTEESPTTDRDFLSSVVRDWEQAAELIPARRRALLRFGIVLGNGGGALPSMLLPFRAMAGGPVGNGRQWMSWIHLHDLTRLIVHTLENDSLSGPVNTVSPEPVRNEQFGRAAARALGRPYWLIAPALPLKLALGEMSELLLQGQRVLPEKALKSGFRFHFAEIQPALDDLLRQPPH
ncbi:TIGR01777 family protein [Paenibacillus albicereus]|uniref:TIGR01777 family protein n=1 Tax=Paenibacillus albicereus TaxID=2726185 RepID=A0A6H2GV36_9BACL|nr:TIGR01777 family oxidoreductase [Paenibacillus albicereus]QJC51267.1 TIGR01777 family protein [Paenibacillus albicereus]